MNVFTDPKKWEQAFIDLIPMGAPFQMLGRPGVAVVKVVGRKFIPYPVPPKSDGGK